MSRLYPDHVPTGFVFLKNAEISRRCSLPVEPVVPFELPVTDMPMAEAFP